MRISSISYNHKKLHVLSFRLTKGKKKNSKKPQNQAEAQTSFFFIRENCRSSHLQRRHAGTDVSRSERKRAGGTYVTAQQDACQRRGQSQNSTSKKEYGILPFSLSPALGMEEERAEHAAYFPQSDFITNRAADPHVRWREAK